MCSCGGVKSLIAELFMNAGCEVIMSSIEADREIANICFEKDCYGVLSNDSDYLIFGVPLLIDSRFVSFSRSGITFKCISSEDVKKTLRISTELMPLFVILNIFFFFPQPIP